MPFLTMLYQLFLMPIQLVFEVVFSYAYIITGARVGLAIIALSLAINLLVLPLYRRADTMQEEERLTEAKLHDGVAHIKKAFKGDERTMILQTYYRQNNYSPLYVLRSAVSLFLEIPFFIAAYSFLSGLSLIQGVSFGPIADLGKPDNLIAIGGMSINLLPILMTAVNVVSTVIFTKGYPLKTKIQLYGMAVFFLVFLYDSPSGLVFYWTLNNFFSLVKTVFYKIKNPQKTLRILLLVVGCCLVGFGLFDYSLHSGLPNSLKKLVMLLAVGVLLSIPFIFNHIKRKTGIKLPEIKTEPDKKLFWVGAVFLTILIGILIPSAVISSSPQEFIIIGNDMHPIWYIISSFLVAAGVFILWMGVFYRLFSPKSKVIMERLMIIACGVGVVDYLFFGNNLGTISTELVYNNGISYNSKQILLNSAVVIVVAAVLLFLLNKANKATKGIVVAASVAMICMSAINTVGIFSSVAEVDMDSLSITDNQPSITLSKNRKNVIVLMLDRAMGEYVPFIMNENPELKEKFSGFTYYSNVVSYGGYTNFGTPALFGGYEYTPIEMNKRDSESLKAKQNEALRVMPVVFDDAGYDVTVCDPPYADYKWIPDLSIYDDRPDIQTYITQGNLSLSSDETKTDKLISNRQRNFFCYSITKVAPVIVQRTLYNDGKYHQRNRSYSTFEKAYDVLKALSSITCVEDNQNGSFVMMNNDSTHEPELFSDKDYLQITDTYDAESYSSMTVNEVTLNLKDVLQVSHYQTNTAALIRLGEWFDYLKKQGVYDNTRIILVSDHGRGLQQIEDLMIDDTAQKSDVELRFGDVEYYYPLLMVKDFDSTEFTTSDEFMTNADVPTLATEDLFESCKNPFTGKVINNNEKTDHDQLIIASNEWDIQKNNGNKFLPARWYSVHDSIWNKDNWELISENAVLSE